MIRYRAAAGPATRWWERNWVTNTSSVKVAPKSHRRYNLGVMSQNSSGVTAYQNRMGHNIECISGNCGVYGMDTSVVPAGSVCTTWDELTGGPYANGDNAVAARTQLDFGWLPQMSYWYNSLPGTVWGFGCMTMLPRPSHISVCTEVANGTWRARYQRMGARLRWKLAQTGRHDIEQNFGIRINWEGMNQNTGLLIDGPVAPGFNASVPNGAERQFYIQGGTFQLYTDMMGAFSEALWDGAGYRIPLAFSPAMTSTGTVPSIPYRDYVATGTYDMCCGSFHPKWDRCNTDANTRGLVYGRSGYFTVGDAITAAIEFDKVVAVLESGAVQPDTAARDVSRYDMAYAHLADIFEANPGRIGFHCLLQNEVLTPTYYSGRGDPQATDWSDYATTFYNRFKAIPL